MFIRSKQHKAINGHVDGEPYHVFFDEDGYAEVDESVGDQLLRIHAAEAVQEQDSPDIEKMNVPQLKKYAKENGIDIGDATKKADILPIIEAAQKPDGGDAE